MPNTQARYLGLKRLTQTMVNDLRAPVGRLYRALEAVSAALALDDMDAAEQYLQEANAALEELKALDRFQQ